MHLAMRSTTLSRMRHGKEGMGMGMGLSRLED